MNELENYAIKQIQRIRKEPTDRLEQGFWIKVGLVDYYISFSITKKKNAKNKDVDEFVKKESGCEP